MTEFLRLQKKGEDLSRFILSWLILLAAAPCFAAVPITPLPLAPDYHIEQAQLGKQLFFDPLLSKDQTLSCASCHDPGQGGADGRSLSVGVGGKLGGANAPTVFNSSLNFVQFWNGRARTLEEQALGPIQNPVEMNLEIPELLARLAQHPKYPGEFAKAFGPGPITAKRVAQALAEFEKALITPNSRFDRFLRGQLELTEAEQKGYTLFKNLGCISCHNGQLVGGNSFQKVGVVNPYPRHGTEPDRHQVTGRQSDLNRYKVPSLRMAASTAPYFHDGNTQTLEEAIVAMGYYNLGVNLKESEVALLVHFIRSLEGQNPTILEAP